MAQARLREALNAGGPGSQKEKGPQPVDGILSVTPDTPEAVEWRTRRSIIDSAGASSSYLEDDNGPKPCELYGKFTWKIENFSEISKRELRSTVFEVGSYKWYILVYPQGCDVCNHLSLFLCVADYDKLLPGWSHFAQFTIAVVNKDPKKSKYSDTLHRFCKKEHDWGWKKFMELNKVLEGFTVSNTLVIKAQVQVIRDRPSAPFRCLEAQYRRELVRVYLTNVETLARKFVDEKREALMHLRDEDSGFRAFWSSLDPKKRRQLASCSGETVLKGVVKRFFNEKEVTSTLVMDALFSGCKQLEEASRQLESKKGKKEKPPVVTVNAEKGTWSLHGDVQTVLERAVSEAIPPFRDDKANDSLAVRNAQDSDDYSSNYVERDERRLAELGRRAVEMFAVAHVFNDLESAYCEAESIKRQDALIKEEEEAERLEDERAAARSATEKEKRARKKERQRQKKAAEVARKEAEDEERRKQEAIRKAEAEKRAAELALQRKKEEAQREKERQEALKERAASFRAREASRVQEAADAAAKVRAAEIQERPAARARSSSPEAAAGTTGRAGTASVEDDAAAGTTSAASRNGGSQGLGTGSDDGSISGEDATLSTGASWGDVTSEEEEPAAPSPAQPSRKQPQPLQPAERQGSMGPIRGHVEYLQAQLAASTSALAALRAELAEANNGWNVTRKELAERMQELAERTREVATLRAALTELRQKAASSSTPTGADNRSSISEVSYDSRPASRASSLDLSGPEHSLAAHARTSVQAGSLVHHKSGSMSQHGSMDGASSESPHPPRADSGHALENGAASNASSTSHMAFRPRQAWNGVAAGDAQQQPARAHSGPTPSGPQQALQQQSPQPPQHQHSSTGSDMGAARGAAAGRGRGAAAVPPLSKEGNAAIAAATAAAAAALRPTPRTAAANAGGAAPAASGSGRGGGGPGQAKQSGNNHVAGGGDATKNASSKMLNGNAAAFVPSLPPPNSLAPSSSLPNGTISYRNAAVGSAAPIAASSPRRGMHNGAVVRPVGSSNKGGPAQGPSVGQHLSGKGSGQPPASPSAAIAATTTSDQSLGRAGSSNDGADGQYGLAYGMAQSAPQQGYTTPVVSKKPDQPANSESPGLDDFAHMGLITDLLD
ncbi:g1429 [Coccomyxa elongata]